MRVLLISHTCQSKTAGQPRAEGLSKSRSIDLRVLIPDRWYLYGEWQLAQVPQNSLFACEVGKVIWPWLGPAQWYLHWYPHLAQILKEFQPHIIDLWEEPWGLVSAHTCWLRNRFLPKTKIVSETEQNINKSLPFPFEQFRSYTLKNIDSAIVRNQEAIEVLRAKGYKGPAEVVPNGVDINLFRPLDRNLCRRELGLSGFVVGYVGRIVEEKGLMDMVEALVFCPEDTHLLFVGAGPFRRKLENRINEIKKTKQVDFLSNQTYEDLPRLMNAMDVLTLVSRTTPSWKEQFGRVIVEAQACQTPVIGSDSGAIPEVLDQGGLIVPERNPQALAVAIKQLYESPELRIKLGLFGRCQAEEKYSWEKVVIRMRNIYVNTAGLANTAEAVL